MRQRGLPSWLNEPSLFGAPFRSRHRFVRDPKGCDSLRDWSWISRWMNNVQADTIVIFKHSSFLVLKLCALRTSCALSGFNRWTSSWWTGCQARRELGGQRDVRWRPSLLSSYRTPRLDSMVVHWGQGGWPGVATDAGGAVDLAEGILPCRSTGSQDRRFCSGTRGIRNAHPIGTPADSRQSFHGCAAPTVLRMHRTVWHSRFRKIGGATRSEFLRIQLRASLRQVGLEVRCYFVGP